MSFQDKVVLVTGASSGIGAAIAILFSKEGANVTMVGRNQTKLDNVAKQCAKPPLVINADLGVENEAKRIVEETVNKFGKLDVLVNNAGLAKYGNIIDGNILEAYDVTLNVNLRAVIHTVTVAAPHLIKTKGNIINISSVASSAILPLPSLLPYGISKAGLDHFTKAAALELSASGVRVNSINPGPVRTDFIENNKPLEEIDPALYSIPLNRMSESEEIADLVAFVASDKARGITGSIYFIDNGQMLKH